MELKKAKPATPSKIRGTKLRKIGKILLWIMIIAIFAKGVIDIAMGNTISKQRAELESYMKTVSSEQEVKDGAMAFAEEFVRDYLTYDGENRDAYAKRISVYTAKNVHIEEPAEGSVTIIASNAMRADLVDKTHINVIVAAEVQIGKQISKMNIAVPITAQNGQYAVDEYPQIVPHYEAADVDATNKTINATEVSNTQKDQISSVIESFFKVYYDGSANELMYYLSEDSEISRGIEGSAKFDSIENMRIFYLAEDDIYRIDSTIKVENSGVLLQQHLFLSAKKEGDRFYIIKIDTRL